VVEVDDVVASAVADEVLGEDCKILEAFDRKYIKHFVKSVEYWSGSWMILTPRDS
jgi:hypothetical protein